MKINGGFLQPTPITQKTDLCYGVDAAGCYLGVVSKSDPRVASYASGPPPSILRDRCRWAHGAWVFTRTNDEIEAEIERERDARIDAGVQWGGRLWYADESFRSILGQALVLYQEGVFTETQTCDIRAKDKTIWPLTRGEIRELAAAVAAHVQAIYEWSWAAKAEVGLDLPPV